MSHPSYKIRKAKYLQHQFKGEENLPNSGKNIFAGTCSYMAFQKQHLQPYHILGDTHFKANFAKHQKSQSIAASQHNLYQLDNLSAQKHINLSQVNDFQELGSPSALNNSQGPINSSIRNSSQVFISRSVPQSSQRLRNYDKLEQYSRGFKTIKKSSNFTEGRQTFRQTLDQNHRRFQHQHIFQRYSQVKTQWNRNNSFLKKVTGKQKSLTYDTSPSVLYIENPKKIDLINDNIPEYWEQSLRNNSKRLRKYLRGHSCGDETLSIMLQTDKGTKKAEEGVPKLNKTVQALKVQGKGKFEKWRKGKDTAGMCQSMDIHRETTTTMVSSYKTKWDKTQKWFDFDL